MAENIKHRLLIFYDYFYPAYKAGGPIQSLTNLMCLLQNEYDISVVTSAYDLNDDRVHDSINLNAWNEVSIPNSSATIKIWYAASGEPRIDTIKKIVKHADPSVIYLNGMFSAGFVLKPLFTIKKIKIVICPRGMLQVGALAGKAFKKRIFLSALKLSGVVNKVSWHATNPGEAADIIREFGKLSKIFVAGNIPKRPVEKISLSIKESGRLKLVYLSLVSEKKNLLQAINIIRGLKENISIDIYGPIKDETYWKKCMQAINDSAGKARYMGDVLPQAVQDVFGNYHASILLTKGENFGHALYESFSAGRPVITSYFTPWNDLVKIKAGWNVDITNDKDIVKAVNELYNMDQSSFDEFCYGSYKLANEYYQQGVDIADYKKMFSE
ncbi:MAG: glycosyltransferase [Ferruginibacter sp.]